MMASSLIAELCIYILTWNVGTQEPSASTSLQDALTASRCPGMPDIYVVSMQEVNTNPKTHILSIFNDNPWTFKILEYLDRNDYVKLETEQQLGLLIAMFVRREHLPHINDIETESTRTGFGGLWGNKGAVGIRMSLYGTGVTFVGAHLAAHDTELKERIADYHQIVNNHHYKKYKYRNIFDHDFVFWFGDLNFRLTGDDSAWDVRSMVEQGKLVELFERDQLKLVRESGNAFSLMHEAVPTFPPTFKFIEDTSDYNLERRPAWCDRVLYRVQEDRYPDIKLSLKQLSYRSHPNYTLSDHKPVSAEFEFKIEAKSGTDQELYEMTHGGGPTETPYASVIILVAIVHVLRSF